MASNQIISYGATVERSDDGTTGWEAIPECKGVAVPQVTQEYPEVTSFDSPDGYREYIKGLKDAGEVEVPCGYTSAGFAMMKADQDAPAAIFYRVTLRQAPDQSTEGDVFTFLGLPTPSIQPGDVGDPIEMSVTIRTTGDFDFVAGFVIQFEHDGKVFTLELTFRALKAYQKATGEAAGVAIESLEKIDVVRFGQLFQAACQPQLTEGEVEDLLDGLGMKEALSLFGRAVSEAFPRGEENAAPKATAPSLALAVN